jgi:hypothetical protein
MDQKIEAEVVADLVEITRSGLKSFEEGKRFAESVKRQHPKVVHEIKLMPNKKGVFMWLNHGPDSSGFIGLEMVCVWATKSAQRLASNAWAAIDNISD